jgi:hypothetical protein
MLFGGKKLHAYKLFWEGFSEEHAFCRFFDALA